MKKLFIFLFVLSSVTQSGAQNKITLKGDVDIDTKSITIKQTIVYKNTSNTQLTEIYLNDWNHSYSSKTTPLAKRFEEEFNTKFHLAKNKDRGYTTISNITDENNSELKHIRLKEHPDVIKVDLKNPLLSEQSYTINLSYTLVLPDDGFTNYGFTKDKDFNLKYWYITPTVYNDKWNYYSNKDLDDLYIPKADVHITLNHPKTHNVFSELDITAQETVGDLMTTVIEGKNRTNTFLSLNQSNNFSQVKTDDFTIISDIYEKGLIPQDKAIITDKVTRFLVNNLGEYPHKRLLVTALEYNKNPLYGLNQLPDIIRPFPSDFQYELKLLKTALKKYIDNILLTNPRKDYWLSEGLQIYFLMKYVEDYYPDTKFLGTVSKIWLVRTFHLAEVDYNFQYFLYSMEIARKNNDQPLTTSKDSLIKFNANIASKYKAGVGLNYLDEYAEDINFRTLIKDYLNTNKLKQTSSKDFENFIKSKTDKNINWFFTDYLNTRKKIDFKITNVKTQEDSIQVTIKNKRDNTMPISLFSLKNDSILSKTWVDDIGEFKTITIPNKGADKLVLDNDNIIPEFNQRDNYKSTKGTFLTRKPLQFRLFKDVEDPYYNQVFLTPLVEFRNIYDGLTLGTRIYNKTILRKRFNYRFAPQYATNSKSLTGSSSLFYTHNIENSNLFNISYGVSVAYRSFAEDAFFTRFIPNISFSFRNDDDFRSDKRQTLSLRYVDISRNIGEDAVIELNEPDYGVLNLRYVKSSPGIINFSRFFADFQIADNFSKLSINYEYRKLFKNNRNLNFRFYAGTFLKNNTDPDSDFFSFALDRPTDYLFDFNYLGRSEDGDEGLVSQQIIIAEGGFKSQLDTPFANQWLTTANVTTSIWRYVQAYGDIGLVKNRFADPKFVYDSGIRLNLVQDFFELFFPVYSNNGWEIAQPNYDQKIRFIITVDPQVLLGLFRRKWY
ncbi:metalloprotease [Winogradskyella sp. E313]|uniref:Metalloprotease n=1 Tax=Winogradskyella immobilis TaxID=2816852 RepID=A0ABS8EM27_9FLAO|nr:metalloprotease [Winogradskyella immobilis]MCG0016305.1 metalloprotease [Winogradskyella immobilis]